MAHLFLTLASAYIIPLPSICPPHRARIISLKYNPVMVLPGSPCHLKQASSSRHAPKGTQNLTLPALVTPPAWVTPPALVALPALVAQPAWVAQPALVALPALD